MTIRPHLTTDFIIKVFLSPEKNLRAWTVLPTLAAITEMGQATIDDIMERLRISRRACQSALLTVERSGLITVQRKSNGYKGKEKNVYRIKP